MKIFLLLYFILFFGLAMILPTYRIWKTTGVNPYKLGSSDTAHDYIGKNFRLIMLVCFLVAIVFAVSPNLYSYLLPISFLTNNILANIGFVLLLIALVWVLIAQVHMQKSWRIGIDEDVKTELVQTGLFKISRNPIFLGMRVMLLGLFLIIPNAITLTILITGEMLIQTQVRLEEEFLTRSHGQAYLDYQKQVRRWI
ncbi:MAG TPA: isoprenylcysteine carboxylmethyltransferase family protein [Anaerolineae bacterium]|nr:isoprenylcysteine carboxylmethyltransferase family protein [Anaerolineae bacterium]